MSEHGRGPAGAQRIGVVDAVASRQRRGDEREHLVAGVRAARRGARIEVRLDELAQAGMRGEGGRQQQPRVGHQPRVVEGHTESVEGVRDARIYQLPFS